MSNLQRLVALICSAAILAGCGAANETLPGSRPVGTPAAGQAPSSGRQTGKGKLAISIRIPVEQRHRRGSRYISAATKGIAMAFSGPTTFTQAIGLTPGPNCSGTPLQCNLVIALSAGKYVATVNTYDQPPVNGLPNGNVLSSAHNVPVTVIAGKSNAFHMVLDGVPATLVIGGFPQTGVAGTAFSAPQTFSVQALDGGGNIIVGTYAAPIALTDNDATGSTSIATSGSDSPPAGELLSSGDTAQIAYTGNAFFSSATIGATAGAVTGLGVFAVQTPVYVADANDVYEIPSGCTTVSCFTSLGSGWNDAWGIAVDGRDNVYVGDRANTTLKVLTIFGTSNLGSGLNQPQGITIDQQGDIFVATGGGLFELQKPSYNVTQVGVGTIPAPTYVVADRLGNVFVTEFSSNEVLEILAVDGSIPANPTIKTIFSGIHGPQGIAVDALGNVYVASFDGITELLAVNGSLPASPATALVGGAFTEPSSVAVDGFGNLFVLAGDGSQTLYEIPPGCIFLACRTVIGPTGEFSNESGLAVRPF